VDETPQTPLFIRKLQVDNLRNLQQVELAAHPAINTLDGTNGAGKTSILESIVILSRGRSFRSHKIGQLIGPRGRECNHWHDPLVTITRSHPAHLASIAMPRDCNVRGA
jgi:recombinational DNA repair ATPase RecF